MKTKNQIQYHEHRGWMMRSHTELLWAKVFDASKIQYLHEPGVFNTPHGWYLPDFYMPNIGAYVEIKGVEPTDIEKAKAVAVMAKTGKPLVIINGKPMPDRNGFCSCQANFYLAGKWVQVPMCYYSDLYIQAMGQSEWMKLYVAGAPERSDGVVCLSEVLATWASEKLGRSFYEKLAKGWRDETAAKVMASLPPPSQQEAVIKEYLETIHAKYNEPTTQREEDQ